MRDLKVFYDDNTLFQDFSGDARDYLRDDFNFQYTAGEDFLYVGLYKPFNSIYAEFTTADTSAAVASYSYFNGSGFVSISDIKDDTKNFKRSGFIKFEKPEDWQATTVNNEDLFWVRVSFDIDTDPLVIRGLNTVFSDDNSLRQEQRNINDLLAKGDSSFIAYHVASRNEIIQTLRNGGNYTRVDGSFKVNDLTQWDILKPEQISEAAKFLTLSKIFFDVSSNVDDKWYQKYKDSKMMFGSAFKLYLQAIDTDDDGINDEAENNNFRNVVFRKV